MNNMKCMYYFNRTAGYVGMRTMMKGISTSGDVFSSRTSLRSSKWSDTAVSYKHFSYARLHPIAA